jgi:hypothetical protein
VGGGEGVKSKRQAFFKIAKCKIRHVQNARNPMSVQLLSCLGFEDVYHCCNGGGRNRHTTAQPAGLGTVTANNSCYCLLASGSGSASSLLSIQAIDDLAAILVAAAAKWTPSAAHMDATLAVSNNSYTLFSGEPKRSTKVENCNILCKRNASQSQRMQRRR